MSTPAGVPPFSDADYARESAALLARIEAAADRWLQDDVIDIDTQRTGGLLELSFPNGSKIIVNTQPPLHEVWLAARGGGFHFRWVEGKWRDTRDGSEFVDALSRHASAQGGKPLDFGLDQDSRLGTGSAGPSEGGPLGAEGRGSKSACADLDGPKRAASGGA